MKNLGAKTRSRIKFARSEVPVLRDSESHRVSRLGYVAASQGAETVQWKSRG